MPSARFFSLLRGTMFQDVRWFPEIDSTNRYLLDEARSGAPEGAIAFTDYQSSGRGRRERTWTAEPGTSILASVLLRPNAPAANGFLFTAMVGLSIIEACKSLGISAVLKWPNDVLIDERKVAGILSESIVEGGELSAVVVGFGINVTTDIPDEFSQSATSISASTDQPVDRESLLSEILVTVDRRYRLYDLAEVLDDYRQNCDTLGRTVQVDFDDGRVVEGKASSVDTDGSLLLEHNGETERVSVADVTHLRSVI